MSLLEKASGGHKPKNAPSQGRTSLFTRAMAASRDEAEVVPPKAPAQAPPAVAPPTVAPPVQAEPERPFIALEELDELESRVAALPPRFDSVLAAWSILSERLPLAAMALFLPQGDFLSLAAQSGFPSGTGDAIPVSIAPPSQRNDELLGDEAKALVAPTLGVSLGMDLRAVSMWSDVGLAGLWVFHDEALESSPPKLVSRLGDLLAKAAASLPASPMAIPVPEPASALAARARKYGFAAALRFDIGSAYGEREAFRGLEANALRSALLSASGKMLEQTGTALAFGERSIACALGSSSPFDPELALFQFSKTLRRSLPFLSGGPFPEGLAASFDPSSDRAVEELSRFLSA
jgi:hypothetical protein